ncbi:MAG: hypothetical protein ABL958_19820, partial [Bdellovibrionia bacterium]
AEGVFPAMIDEYFPKFKTVVPDLITSQIRESKFAGLGMRSSALVDVLARKLIEHEPMTSFELEYLCSQFDLLPPPTKPLFVERILSDTSSTLRERIVSFVTESLSPSELGRKLFRKSEIDKWHRSYSDLDGQVLFEFFNSPSTDAWLASAFPADIAKSILKLGKSNRTYSTGQRRVFEKFRDGGHLVGRFESEFELLSKYGLDTQEIGVQLDRILGAIFDKNDSGWDGRIFDPLGGFQKMIKFLRENAVVTDGFMNLRRLEKFISDLNENLRELSEKVPERGQYWSSKLRYCSRIEMQKSTSFAYYAVCVAFHINGYVLCEFGPKGYALHVYKTHSFDAIRIRKSWMEKKLTEKMPPYTRDEGTLWHVGNWQKDFNQLIEFILRQS